MSLKGFCTIKLDATNLKIAILITSKEIELLSITYTLINLRDINCKSLFTDKILNSKIKYPREIYNIYFTYSFTNEAHNSA